MSDDRIARIEAIIDENAALLGEKPELGLRLRPDGSVRIQQKTRDGRWVRGDYKSYPTIDAAYEAALVANRRAQKVGALRATGLSLAEAIAATR